jgi:hypothetical protein
VVEAWILQTFPTSQMWDKRIVTASKASINSISMFSAASDKVVAVSALRLKY